MLSIFFERFAFVLLGAGIAVMVFRILGTGISKRGVRGDAIMLVSMSAAIALAGTLSQGLPVWQNVGIIGLASGLGVAIGQRIADRLVQTPATSKSVEV